MNAPRVPVVHPTEGSPSTVPDAVVPPDGTAAAAGAVEEESSLGDITEAGEALMWVARAKVFEGILRHLRAMIEISWYLQVQRERVVYFDWLWMANLCLTR